MARRITIGRINVQSEAEAIEKLTSLISRKIALDVLSRVVLATPVDTGRARANWQAEVGSAPTTELQTTDKGGGSTISQGSANIATHEQTPFSEINIVNNLPYIGRLNDGSSTQAPAGFVESAVDAAAKLT